MLLQRTRPRFSLGSLLLGGSILGSLLASTGIALVYPGLSGLRVGITLLHLGSDCFELVFGSGGSSWENSTSGLVGGVGTCDLLGCGIVDLTLLGFTFTSWEEDKLGFVRVESLDVELELLLAG